MITCGFHNLAIPLSLVKRLKRFSHSPIRGKDIHPSAVYSGGGGERVKGKLVSITGEEEVPGEGGGPGRRSLYVGSNRPGCAHSKNASE